MIRNNENSGAIFTNQKTKDIQPDMTGTCTIGGKSYRVAAWTKQGNKGKFLSLKFTDYEEKNLPAGKPEVKADYKAIKDGDFELPF